ncbi:MAG: PIN domain-containing protein [Thermomicrobiales bacterium]
MTLQSLDAALGRAERVLIDSSTIIAFHEQLELAHPLALHVLRRIADDHDFLRGYCSVISVSELLIRPIRTSQQAYDYMHRFLTTYPHMTLLSIDLTVSLEAANLRSMTGAQLPDALIVASGLLAGCEAIITNDARWKGRFAPLFRQFNWVYLGDHLPL